MLERVKDIFARVETGEGVWTDPLSAPYNVVAFDPELTEEHEEIARQTAGSSLSRRKTVVGRSTASVNFTMDLRGSGNVLGVPVEPEWGPILQACGMRMETLGMILVENWAAPLAHKAVIGNHGSSPTATGIAVGNYATAAGHTIILYIPTLGTFANSDPVYKTTDEWSTSTKVADVTSAGATALGGWHYVPETKIRYQVATSAAGWTTGATTEVGETVKGTKGGSPDAYGVILAGSGLATGSAQTLYIEPIIGTFVDAMVVTGQTNGDTATLAADAAPKDNWTLSVAEVLDGMAIKVRGCRGNAKIVLSAGQPSQIQFELKGMSEGEIDMVSLTGGTKDPGAPLRFHLAEFSVDGIPFRTEALEIDLGNAVNIRTDANEEEGGVSHIVADRDAKGTMTPEMVPPGTYSWRDRIKESTLVAISTYLGVGLAGIGLTGHDLGSNVWIEIPSAQVLTRPLESREGILVGNIGFALRTETIQGEDELEIYVV
ncbi:MAG: hypothetical protein M0R66_04345 [Candidatus Omnitrophica bacterium]|jgi:hypothetical protein|nr:hypothetical protein [Candidatus Omnitrophota bacterium]